jgi:hypothetical protein
MSTRNKRPIRCCGTQRSARRNNGHVLIAGRSEGYGIQSLSRGPIKSIRCHN